MNRRETSEGGKIIVTKGVKENEGNGFSRNNAVTEVIVKDVEE